MSIWRICSRAETWRSAGYVRLRAAFAGDMGGAEDIKPEELTTQRVLGAGAFAVVELATYRPLGAPAAEGDAPPQSPGRPVAVKRLKPEVCGSSCHP